jgi:hypothetical protein
MDTPKWLEVNRETVAPRTNLPSCRQLCRHEGGNYPTSNLSEASGSSEKVRSATGPSGFGHAPPPHTIDSR